VSALAGTISAPIAVRVDGIGAGRLFRSLLSLLVAAGILAVALPVAFGSGAQGAGTNPAQVFSSGSLLAPDASGTAQLSVSGLVPGQSRTATIRVVNPGSASTFSLTGRVADRVGSGGVALSSALRLEIDAVGSGKALYSGSLASMPRLALGGFAAGAQHIYRFTVSLPAGVGNGVAGSATSAGFAWNAS